MEGASEPTPPAPPGQGPAVPPGELKVSFTLSAEDLVKGRMETLKRPRLFLLFSIVWTFLVWQVFALFFASRMDPLGYTVVAACAGALSLASLSSLTKRRVNRQALQISRTPLLQGVQNWILDPRGVRISRPYANSAYSWRAFTSAVETKSCFLFYLQPRQAAILPKSAFPSREAAMEARRLIALGSRGRFQQRGVAGDERVQVV